MNPKIRSFWSPLFFYLISIFRVFLFENCTFNRYFFLQSRNALFLHHMQCKEQGVFFSQQPPGRQPYLLCNLLIDLFALYFHCEFRSAVWAPRRVDCNLRFTVRAFFHCHSRHFFFFMSQGYQFVDSLQQTEQYKCHDKEIDQR